ncbi:MAG: DNA polymerase IV [Sedimentisphaerales bacterium]
MGQMRQIIHVDMDAFYASVEQLDNPEYKGQPVIVGGDPKGRGVVSAASYEARQFGIHSAMPMTRAIRLCPELIVLPVRMARYRQVSQQVHAIFKKYTPLVESVSLDEAFLDVTGSTKLFGSAEQIGLAIKTAIKDELKLTASVGVAPNKFLAKLASGMKKPDGFVVITEQNKQEILEPLPVSKIWGVGKVTEQALQAHAIQTIAQLRQTPLEQLKVIVGNFAPVLLQLACGIDESEVQPARQAKSLSSERTFAADVQDEEVLLDALLNQVEQVGQRLRAANLLAKTVAVKLRYADFRTITKSFTLGQATNTTRTLWQTAKAIFQIWQAESAGPLRLIGFAASGLIKEDTSQASRGAGSQQLLFNDPKEEKQKRLDEVVDKIKNRYGKDSLRRNYGVKRKSRLRLRGSSRPTSNATETSRATVSDSFS